MMTNFQILFELELKLLNTSTRRNFTELNNLLSPDFQEIGSSGIIYSREEVINALLKEESVTIEAYDFKAYCLAEGVTLVTYKTRVINDQGITLETLRSSIWKLHDQRWQMVFHQGTTVPLT